MNDFIEIFKHAFHKFSLVGVKSLGKRVSNEGREFYRFIGKFEFEPPAQVFDGSLEDDKPYILQQFQNICSDSSNCFKRKFTKKLLSGGNTTKKVDFQYIFDIVPENVIDFELDRKAQKMFLQVLGYGTF